MGIVYACVVYAAVDCAFDDDGWCLVAVSVSCLCSCSERRQYVAVVDDDGSFVEHLGWSASSCSSSLLGDLYRLQFYEHGWGSVQAQTWHVSKELFSRRMNKEEPVGARAAGLHPGVRDFDSFD